MDAEKLFPSRKTQIAELERRLTDEPESAGRLVDQAIASGMGLLAAAAPVMRAARCCVEPDEQRRLIYLYLKLHCAEELGSDHSLSLVELFDSVHGPSTDRDRDIALAALRALDVDAKWYVGSRLGEPVLEWLTNEWNKLCGQHAAQKKARSAGNAGANALAALSDAERQFEAAVNAPIDQIGYAPPNELADVLKQVHRATSRVVPWVTRRERQLIQTQLRLMTEVAESLSGRSNSSSAFETASDAQAALDDANEMLDGLLALTESSFLSMSAVVQTRLVERFRFELARWGELKPRIQIRPERGSYSFVGREALACLLIGNDGALSADRVEIMIVPNSAAVEPDTFAFSDLEPGDEVRQVIHVEAAEEIHRLDFAWMAMVKSRSDEPQEQEGEFAIEGDHDIDWKSVASRPNPYSTTPVDVPERLYGRAEDLERLKRAIQSGESRYLTGQRRVGKTSLLLVLFDELREGDYLPIWAPWGEIGGPNFASVCNRLCRKMAGEAKRARPDVPAIEVPSLQEFQDSFNATTVDFVQRIHRLYRLHLVIGFDDFDDVPNWVYSGEEGELFFSMIKTLTGRRGISLVFVGGQKLQRIMRSNVAAKLNQVTAINLDYLEKEVIRDLVEGPAAGILKFDTEAVERIAFWSAGNPFYSNRICNQLWDLMVSEQHCHVIRADVERVLEQTVAHDESPLFSHFWSDGIWGDGSDDQQRLWQSANALVLWAIGRLQASAPGTEYQPFDMICQESRLPDTEARKWVGDLVSRRVLFEHPHEPDQYRTAVPYFQLWLARRGSSELYPQIDHATIAVSSTEPDRIADEEIESVFSTTIVRYRGEPVGPYEVRKFLEQFGAVENQRLILPLVRRLLQDGFISELDLRESASEALQQLRRIATVKDPNYKTHLTTDGEWTNVFLLSVREDVGSSRPLSDLVRQAGAIPKLHCGDEDKLIEVVRKQKSSVAVLLFDDIIGTGGTASKSVDKTIAALTANGLLDRVSCVVFFAHCGFNDVIESLNSTRQGEAMFIVRNQLHKSDEGFDPNAGIFDTDNERQAAARLVESVGAKLDERFPLGYGSRQALLTSYRNTPNLTLPIFWKSSRRHAFPWKPLLRRI